jgi:DNA-binding NarL/FixJ family response regulator
LASGRIVVVDDSYTTLSAVRERLARDGYEVTTLAHPECEAAVLRGVDLVIIDFHMTFRDGAAALTQLRKKAAVVDCNASFYLYTSDETEATSFKKHGFDGAFAVKGDLDALAKQVSAAFRTRKLRQLRSM